jgi:type I restriction enzyme R subunit
MTEITAGMNVLGLSTARDDRTFIQSRIAKQYMAQYNETYPAA